MLIGYVSDENYLGIPDVAIEFEQDGKFVASTHSTASGAVHAEIAPGNYRVTLAKPVCGSIRCAAQVEAGKPQQFRLLTDSLYGYAWPKWVKSGEQAEFRVHSPEGYFLTLWRYGWKKEMVQSI